MLQNKNSENCAVERDARKKLQLQAGLSPP
jgi:hypothetical protein